MNAATLHSDGSILAGSLSVKDEVLACLACQIELENGYRLRSFFSMLERYPLLAKTNTFCQDLLEQARNCPADGCEWPGFSALEFSKTVEMIGFPGKPRLEIYNVFRGVQGDETEEIRSLRLESLLDMPIRLGNLRHVIFGDKVDVFEFETVYTLFEFIDGIVWELSFHGSPRECQLRR
jgi:hypothetical protein